MTTPEDPPAGGAAASTSASPSIDHSYVNAEAAQQSLDLGKAALEAGNHQRAIALLQKSIRLRKTAEAEALLGLAMRAAARADSKSDSAEPQPARAHTPEQLKGVKTVLKAKTHYEVLCIERTADDAAIKRAYRKMALTMHPDKNSAPGADEAFKKISTAFSVLADPQTRAHYDRYGDADPNLANRAGGMPGGGMHGFHEMDPDELFRAFFGGAFNGGGGGGAFGPGVHFQQFNFGPQPRFQQQRYRAGGGGGGGRQQQPPDANSVLWMFAMVFIFLSMFLGPSSLDFASSGSARPPFGFKPGGQLQVPRTTAGLNGLLRGIPYFVSPQFGVWARVPENLYKFEAHVQDSYAPFLQQECRRESDEKTRALAYARTEAQKSAAKAMAMPR